jgi:hypothetical protein
MQLAIRLRVTVAVAICFCAAALVAAEDAATISPAATNVAAVRAGTTVAVALDRAGPDAAVLGVLWERFVTIAPVVDAAFTVLPHAYRGQVHQLCPLPKCVAVRRETAGAASKATTVVITLAPTALFDTYVPQRLAVTFGVELFPRRRTPVTVFFTIDPLDETPPPQSYFLSAAVSGLHVATALLLPSTLDSAGALVATHTVCSMQVQRQWLPSAMHAVLPLGGDTALALLWRTVAAVVAVAALFFGLIAFFDRRGAGDARSERLREVLPFLAGQLWLYLLPGVSFAAGMLLTSLSPLWQVVGGVTAVVAVAGSYALHGWLYRSMAWVYVQHRGGGGGGGGGGGSGKGSATEQRLRAMLRAEGVWVNRLVSHTVAKMLPREVRHPARRRAAGEAAVLWAWLLTVRLGLRAGSAPPSPAACAMQSVAVAVAWLVSAVAAAKLAPFRVPLLNVCTVAVRVLTALMAALLGTTPGPTQSALFQVLGWLLVVVLAVRVAFAATSLRWQTAADVATVELAACEAAMREEEERAAADGCSDGVPEELLLVDGAADEEQAGDAAPGADAVEAELALAAASVVSRPMNDADTYRFIREAGAVKPRSEADRLRGAPSWFPPTRPRVRPHNEPDLPLPKKGKSWIPKAGARYGAAGPQHDDTL